VLVDLLERVQFFLKRLGVHTRITPTKDMEKILVKIMAEVLSILAIATKEMQQSRTSQFVYASVIYLYLTRSQFCQKHILRNWSEGRISKTPSRGLIT
jgi:hypothetical protein